MIQGGSSKPKGHVDFKSAFYFQTPVWIAEAPMFLKNKILIRVDSNVHELNDDHHLVH